MQGVGRLSSGKFFVFLCCVNAFLLIFLLFVFFRSNPELNEPIQTVVALVCLPFVILPLVAEIRSVSKTRLERGILKGKRMRRVLLVIGTLLLISLNALFFVPKHHTLARVIPLYVTASGTEKTSVDARNTSVYYHPENAIDNRYDTAWLVPNRLAEKCITLWLDRVTRISKVGIIPGYPKFDPYRHVDRFTQHRRVKRIRLEFSDGTSQELALLDKGELQVMSIHPVETEYVKMTILDTFEAGGEFPQDVVAISEIQLFQETE